MENILRIKTIKDRAVPVLRRHDVKRAAIFGSYARGEQKKRSDVDILIEYKNDDEKSLFDFNGLQVDLQEILKKKVDLVEYSTIRPRIKDRILREQLPIL